MIVDQDALHIIGIARKDHRTIRHPHAHDVTLFGNGALDESEAVGAQLAEQRQGITGAIRRHRHETGFFLAGNGSSYHETLQTLKQGAEGSLIEETQTAKVKI